MANLTRDEFTEAVRLLATDLGLQRMRDKFIRAGALVTRKGISTPEDFAAKLYVLTGGFRRQVAATLAFLSLWNEQVHVKLGKEGEDELESVANEVNACLDEKENIVADKRSEIEEKLAAYETKLAESIGGTRARIDMLMKAVEDVAPILRGRPIPDVEPKAAESPAPAQA